MATDRLTPNRVMHAQQQSPLFNKLPAELRNRIYKMAFEDDFDTVKVVSFGSGQYDPYTRNVWLCPSPGASAPPSSAFLRSCQRLHLEAVAIFTAAAEAYWDSEKEFIIDPTTSWELEPEGLRIPLQPIRNFTFLLEAARFGIKISLRGLEGRRWSYNTTDQSSPSIDNDDGETQAKIAAICSRLTLDIGLGRAAGLVDYGLCDLRDLSYILGVYGVWQDILESVRQSWKPTGELNPHCTSARDLLCQATPSMGPLLRKVRALQLTIEHFTRTELPARSAFDLVGSCFKRPSHRSTQSFLHDQRTKTNERSPGSF